MKKEINALLNATEGSLRLNSIASLDRWKLDALGEEVDRLRIKFARINGVEYSGAYEVKARDTEGIINECCAAIDDFCQKLAGQMTKQLRAGYLPTSAPLNITEEPKDTVKALRASTGLSQAAFAKRYNIPQRTVENWEADVNTPPAYVIEMLRKIVEADMEK